MSFQNAHIRAVNASPCDYHIQNVKRGDPAFRVSPSALKAFATCPARWMAGYEPPDSKAKEWGSLVDALFLTPDQFEARYSLQPAQYELSVMVCPSCESESDAKTCRKCGVSREQRTVKREWNGNASACYEWGLAQLKAGKEIVKGETLFDGNAAVAKLHDDETIKSFSDSSDKQVWLEAEWHDESTGLVIPVRCLIDFVPKKDTEWYKCLGDLKAVRNAGLIPFQRQVYQYGWHVQAAFDTDLYIAATGEDRCQWVFIIQENYEPWQTGKRMLSQDFEDLGRAEYKRLLKLYCQCLKRNEWPDYDSTDESVQGFGMCSAEPWMMNEGQFAPTYGFDDEEIPQPQPERFDINV